MPSMCQSSKSAPAWYNPGVDLTLAVYYNPNVLEYKAFFEI
jgi:hypothetical protein